MDEKILLEAISKMMDDKIGVLREEVNESIGSLREEVTESISGLREEVSENISNLRAEMTIQNNETRVLVKNGYKRIENLLREDYGRVADAAAKGSAVAESHEELKNTVADHDHVLQNHNQRITDLEKKAI